MNSSSTPGPNAAALLNNSTAWAATVQTQSVGVGLSGSGFLVLFYTGVLAVLQHLGVISSSTRLAGASGGAGAALLQCANLPPQQQYKALTDLIAKCRSQNSCDGSLDKALASAMAASVPSNAAQLCSGRLWVSITAAKPSGQAADKNVLQGPNWRNVQQLQAAVRLSSYIPGVSGRSATLQLPELASVGRAYDGGFSQALPCPPGVKACLKVSAFPYTPNPGQGAQSMLKDINSKLAASAQALSDPATGPLLPLNPVVIPPLKPDIYPGLSQPLPVNSTVWEFMALRAPDPAMLRTIYDLGRLEAASWATQQGIASSAAASKALQATRAP